MYAKESSFIAILQDNSQIYVRVCTLMCPSMRLRVYTSISRVCYVYCAGEKKVGRKWKYAIHGTIWKYIAFLSFSLSFSLRIGKFIFLIFCLALLAFRPIPTCFRTSIQSLIVHSHSLILSRCSFSRNPLVTFNAAANCTGELRCSLFELSRESHQERASIKYSLTCARRDVFFC